MKNLFASLILLFVLVSNAQVNLTSGLIAYYPFKSNPIDVSGNNNNGVVSGPTLTSDKNSVPNNAYNYANLSDRITVPYNASLDISGTKNFSAAMWINPSAVNTLDGRLMYFGSIANKDYELIYSSPVSGADSGRIEFYNFSGSTVINVYSSVKVVLNTWSLVIVTVDGNSGVTGLYLNNVLVASSSIMPVIPTSSTSTSSPILTIGNHQTNDWGFKGAIDEVRIYNRLLNASETAYLYSNYSAIKNSATDIKIDFYPNPCSNKINIESLPEITSSIEVYDLMGKLVIKDSFVLRKELDVNFLEPGTYLLKVITEKGTAVKKIEKI